METAIVADNVFGNGVDEEGFNLSDGSGAGNPCWRAHQDRAENLASARPWQFPYTA
ncbi:MAG: hypothetical protein L0H29_07010 [Sinobacteraceae bacterium]|nr:hypothetical protein [Nevskiaceae bacterium]